MSILFELERMERLLADVQELRRPAKIPVRDYWRQEGKAEDGMCCPTDGWEKCRIDEPWTTLESHRWYRTTIVIPEEFNGCHVEFLITTGREGEWDATNPQMLFYLNGKLVQGVDVNHREIRISPHATAGEPYEIAFLAYSGSVPGDLLLHTDLVTVDDRVEKLYYDFLVPVQTARLLKKSDEENYRRILVKLGPAADVLDLRQPYSERFYASVEQAEILLKQEFYTQVNEAAPVVSAVGHTHIDIAWLWTVEQTREKVLRSFSTVLELMERYPEYRFMSSQPILYQFVKEQAPELYERIKEKIREGRWEADGAMWLEADCNLPSGESFVRQIMKGEEFFQREFGVSSKCLWLPDVFGYSASLPQILKKCGIPYFLTTKIAWNQYNQLPNDTFWWKGIDGSRVFVFMPTTCDFDKTLGLNISFTDTRNTTTYTGIVNPNMTLGTFKRFQNRDLTENTLMLFGFGDGGGGPTKEMLENARRLYYGMPGLPRLVQEPEREFFDRTCQSIGEKREMPVWDGELYFEYHRGTLTSMGKNKRGNRESEMLYEQLETMGVMAKLFGCSYPEDILRRGWDVILLNQFHDIIPGSAIGPVYEQTEQEYQEILSAGKNERETLAVQLGTKLWGSPPVCTIAVVNTQGYMREDIVEVCKAPAGVTHAVDEQGYSHPVQYIDEERLIFFADSLPSAGVKRYMLLGGEESRCQKSQDQKCICRENGKQEHGLHFENAWYRAEFNERLELTSLLEKETNCELLKEGRVANQLMTYEDRPMNWDNWDVDVFYRRKPYPADRVSVPVLKQQGPVCTILSVRHEFAGSFVDQDVVLYQDLPRIDFVNRAEWNTHHLLLRVNFPVNINATKASYEIQFGNIERETTNNHSWDSAKFEVCAHKWADLSENGLGISLLNNGKYGHSIKDGEMGLTLIKSGIYPNTDADIGIHSFTYSIYPHKGRWQEARTVEMAYSLNSPLTAVILPGSCPGAAVSQTSCSGAAAAQDSELTAVSGSWSLISIEPSNVFLEMVKMAEDGDGYIVRLYENRNTRTPFKVHLGFSAAEVEECDLLERPLTFVNLCENTFTGFIKPFEIKTYRIRQKMFRSQHCRKEE